MSETLHDHRHGDDANKLRKKKNKKRKRMGTLEGSGSLFHPSHANANAVPKCKKYKTPHEMERHTLPQQLPSPSTPTQSIVEPAASLELTERSDAYSMAIHTSTHPNMRPSLKSTRPKPPASTQNCTPSKLASNTSPIKSQHDAPACQRSPSPDVKLISERSIFQHAQKAMNHAQERYMKLKEELQSMRTASENAEKEHEQEITKFRTKVTTLEAKTVSLEKDNDRLVSENFALKEAKKELKRVSDTSRLHNFKQDNALRNFKNNSDVLNKRKTELDKQIDAQATTIAGLETTNCSLIFKYDTATAEVAALKGKLDDVISESEARNEQISTLKNLESDLTSEIKKLTANEQLLRAGKNALSKDHDKLKQDISSLQSDLDTSKAENTKLEETLATKATVVEEYRTQIKGQQWRIAELESADQVNLKQILDLRSEIDQSKLLLEKQNTEINESRDLYGQRVEEKNARLAILEQNLKTMRTTLDADADTREGENNQLRKDIMAYTGKLAISKNDCARLRKKVEDAETSARHWAAQIESLLKKAKSLTAERDAAVQHAQSTLHAAAEREVLAGHRSATTATSPIRLARDAFSDEDRRILYKAYEEFPDHRYQLRYDGWVIPRPLPKHEWIGSAQVEKIIGIESETKGEALIGPYRSIADTRMEIFFDGRLLRRGFAKQLVVKEEPERHTFEDAGVSITEGGSGRDILGTAYRPLTVHGVPSWRDIALAKRAECECDEERDRGEAREREAEPKRVEQPVSTTTPDPRLRTQPMTTRPAPVAVMVAPIPQPDAAVREPLRRISTDMVSEVGSVQTPALTNDEYISPREMGPETPRSPIEQVSGSLKRKEPMELFDRSARISREPAELIRHSQSRSTSAEDQHKRPRISSDDLDPVDKAPREPRRFKESGEAFRRSRREHDIYNGSGRYDDQRRGTSYPASSYHYEAYERSGPPRRRSPDYGNGSRRERR